MLKKTLSMLLAAVLCIVFVAGCGESQPETTENEPAEKTETNDTGKEDEKESFTMVALLYSRGFEFMVALDEGIQKRAEELGIDIQVLDGNSDSQTQITQIEDNITKGVDAILLAPNNSEELVAGVKKANEAGIPVVIQDGNIAEGCEVVSSCVFDNFAGGQEGAKKVIELLPGGSSVLECTGAQGAYHCVRRGGGFNDGMEDSDLEVLTKDCNWSAEEAQNATVDILSSNSDVKGIFTHNDEMLRGVVAGLKQINRQVPVGEEGHVAVVGVDGTPLALDMIREGNVDATVEQNPFDMGALAVTTAVEYLDGTNTSPEEEQYVYPRVITAENVDDPTNWGNIMAGKSE